MMTTAPGWNADLYSEKHSFVWKLAEDLLQLLSPQSVERILDIGCGTGQLTAQIAASGAVVTGLDSSPEMIHQARQKYPDVRFELGDARDLRLAESFDAVFSNATLHWIREPERVVTSIERVLRPGGRFVAEFGGKGNLDKLFSAIRRSYAALDLPFPVDANLWYFPSIAEYAQFLESRGFEIAQASLFDRPTPLEDGERGLENWLHMFAASFLGKIPQEKQVFFLREVKRQSRACLFHDGQWVLDYRRLRVLAHKPKS
jgi:trans-aconitate 2-methyltransferase